METLDTWLAAATGLAPETRARLLASVAVLVGLWLVNRLIVWGVRRRSDDARTHYQWTKATLYSTVTLGLLILGRLWFTGLSQYATYAGLLSAGLAIALRDLLVNVAGWVFILARRPFEVGDRIQIGGVTGDVIDLRLFQFTLMEVGNWVDADQSTGRVIHVPNARVFSEPQANATKGFHYIWNEIPVLVTFESDWRHAKALLEEIAKEQTLELTDEARRQVQRAAEKYMIFFSKLTPIVYTSVRDSGVLLTIRHLCEPRRRRGRSQAIWEAILDRFETTDSVELAYPTQRWIGSLPPSPESD